MTSQFSAGLLATSYKNVLSNSVKQSKGSPNHKTLKCMHTSLYKPKMTITTEN